MKLNRDTPVPLYYQLAEQIKGQILDGELQPGTQLPAEREYSEILNISRMTVRQALGSLIQQGLLVRQHGVGTFVAEPKLNHDLLHLAGFTEGMMRIGQKETSSQVLEQSLVVPPTSVVKGLKLKSGEQAIKIVRLRLYGGTPLVLETIFVPEILCPGLESKDFGVTSLYKILEQDYGLNQSYAEQTLEGTVANKYESNLFDIPSGMMMFLLEGITYLENDEPVEYFKSVYRGDRFKFRLKSQRNFDLNNVTSARIFVAGVDVVHE